MTYIRSLLLAATLFLLFNIPNQKIVAQADPCAPNAYDTWLNGYGGGGGAGDFNGDGKTDGKDYIVWLNKQGNCSAPEYHPIVDMPTAQQENPNFPNVTAYCQSLGYQGMAVIDQQPKAYGILCVRNGTELAGIDMNAMCRSTNGADSSAQITNPDSAYGWVCTSSTSPQQPGADVPTKVPVPVIMGSPNPTGTFTVRAIANNVNVRSGPGTDNKVVGQISPVSGYFESVGASNGWLHIKFAGGEGWVSIDYVRPPDVNNPTPVPVGPTAVPPTQPVPVPITPEPPLPQCPSGTGPGGIKAGGYTPQNLTQEQRQWLFEQFGHSGIAPVGYGGENCTDQPQSQAKVCPTNSTGPGGIAIGGYDPKILTQEQRQWLFEQFGHSGIAPVGYGGESCTSAGGQPVLKTCPAGVGEPGGFDPTTLTQQQRNDLYHAFGHNGEAPVGYGGEPCSGGKLTLDSFVTPIVPTPLSQGTTDTTAALPIDYGSNSPIGTTSVQITSARGLNIRSGPSEIDSIVGLAAYGSYFEVVGSSDNGWYKIRMSNGQEGWVSKGFVNVVAVAPPTSSPRTTQIGITTFIRTAPEIAPANMFGTLNPGEIYDIVGKSSNGFWLQISYYGSSGWVCRGHTRITDESLMFVIPVTGFSTQDCYGAPTDSSTRGLTLIKTCQNNAFWFDLFQKLSKVTYLDLLMPKSSAYFAETSGMAKDITQVGADIIEGLHQPSGDLVTINIWQQPDSTDYIVEELRTLNGIETSRTLTPLSYNGAVRQCPFPTVA